MIKIVQEVEAEQWLGEEHSLPKDTYCCRPEVHWSQNRELVYFSYADLDVRHWVTAKQLSLPPPEKLHFMCSGMVITRKDGTKYWREAYPFVYWSVKSESSINQNYKAVYLEKDDLDLVSTFLDFCEFEGWTNPLPPRAEYRVVDGGCGRGFRPYYLSPGDWIVKLPSTKGPNIKDIKILSNEKFEAMQEGTQS